jgi:hypothetical protein
MEHLQEWTSTPFFLGNGATWSAVIDTDSEGTLIGDWESQLPSSAQPLLDQNQPFSTFHVGDALWLGTPAVGRVDPGAFSTSYAVVSVPEPAYLGPILIVGFSLALRRQKKLAKGA